MQIALRIKMEHTHTHTYNNNNNKKRCVQHEQRFQKDSDIRIFTPFFDEHKSTIKTFIYIQPLKNYVYITEADLNHNGWLKLVQVTMFAFYQDATGLMFQFNSHRAISLLPSLIPVYTACFFPISFSIRFLRKTMTQIP